MRIPAAVSGASVAIGLRYGRCRDGKTNSPASSRTARPQARPERPTNARCPRRIATRHPSRTPQIAPSGPKRGKAIAFRLIRNCQAENALQRVPAWLRRMAVDSDAESDGTGVSTKSRRTNGLGL
jgi:hypothetical protein